MEFRMLDAIITGLSIVGLLWYLVLWFLGLLGCLVARRRYQLRPRSPLSTASFAPGVSILRPLKGLDTNLYENLESTFRQEYPNFEIIFSVADEDDQALPIARDLMEKYPHIKATIIIGEEIVGVNPKVNNLVRSYRQATNDILWVLDSGIMVQPGTLARSVDTLTSSTSLGFNVEHKNVALVHHVPFAIGGGGKLGSRIEEAFLNTNHAKMYIAINTVALDSCVVGKSNLYRRSDVERINGTLKPHKSLENCGLPAFGKFLAEDNTLASALWHELGLRHDLSCDVAYNAVGNMTLADYVYRRIRWIRVRKHMVLLATLLEPLTECVVLSAIASASCIHLFDIPFWIVILFHYALWISVDLDIYSSLAGYPLPAASRWKFLTAWAARELLALPIFIWAIFGSDVTWRGRRYRILRNGEAIDAEFRHPSVWRFLRCPWFAKRERLAPHPGDDL